VVLARGLKRLSSWWFHFPFIKVFLESLLLKLRDFPLVFLLIGPYKAAVPTLAVASLHSLLRGLNMPIG